MINIIIAFIAGFALAYMIFAGKKIRVVGFDNKVANDMEPKVTTKITKVTKEVTIPPDIAQNIKDALETGNKIEAIKIYREGMGCDLKEAKDQIEALEELFDKMDAMGK